MIKLIDRVKENIAPLWYHGIAYHDYMRREAITMLWPLNLVVGYLLGVWCRIRHNRDGTHREIEETGYSAGYSAGYNDYNHEMRKSHPDAKPILHSRQAEKGF